MKGGGITHCTVLGNMCNFLEQDDATIVVAELSCGFKFWWMYFSLKEGKRNLNEC